MPAKNTIRNYQPDEIYHVYNRGNNKEAICLDANDYRVLLSHTLRYVLKPTIVEQRWPNINSKILDKNMHQEIDLIAYCLMPNHYHLLLKQYTEDAISRLMKQVSNSYTKYFNIKYQRQGCLFQGVYRAIKVNSPQSLLQVSRYIHLNPYTAHLCKSPLHYKWSSLHDYTTNTPSNCSTNILLSEFSSSQEHLQFIHRVQPSDRIQVSPDTASSGETWITPLSE